MTLEPIAALNVAIPRDLRMLNLALVDVGAGTSDIAITKGGTVVAYAMVPTAGDEISEAIAQHFLVDFKTAEQVKLAVSSGQEEVRFLDIMDNEVVAGQSEVLNIVSPAVTALADTLAERMTESNGGRSPNAVFLVGGGSQTPLLSTLLAEKLGLPRERVAVRNRSIAKTISYDGPLLQGPECITPFGILVTAFSQAGRDFFHVFVEDRRIRLYNARRMTISDALLLAGYVPDQLIGKSGKALTLTINGEEKIVRGGFGKPAIIERNGFPAGLTATVSPGDHIHVVAAERGADATSLAGDHLPTRQPVTLVLSGTRYEIPFRILREGVALVPETPLQDKDVIDIVPVASVADIAAMFELPFSQFDFLRDGVPVTPANVPLAGDTFVCIPKAQEMSATQGQAVPAMTPPMEEAAPAKAPPMVEEVPMSAPPTAQAAPAMTPPMAEAPPVPEPDGFVVLVDNQEVFLPHANKEHMLIDIFAHINFDLNQARGTVLLRLNGQDAGYTDILKPGDRIEILWQD
jgi:hypothetical protein